MFPTYHRIGEPLWPSLFTPFRRLSIGATPVPVLPWYLTTGVTASDVVCAYKAKGAASLAASYVNLANPGTNNAAPGVAPTFNAATGWTFNGTTQYLTTGNLTITRTMTVIIRYSGATLGNTTSYDLAGIVNSLQIAVDDQEGTAIVGQYYTASAVTTFADNGVIALNNSGVFYNKTKTELTAGAADNSTQPIYIGAGYTTPPNAVYFYAGNIQAVAIYSKTLTDLQVGHINDAMVAL